jgi:hypothetical protein
MKRPPIAHLDGDDQMVPIIMVVQWRVGDDIIWDDPTPLASMWEIRNSIADAAWKKQSFWTQACFKIKFWIRHL